MTNRARKWAVVSALWMLPARRFAAVTRLSARVDDRVPLCTAHPAAPRASRRSASNEDRYWVGPTWIGRNRCRVSLADRLVLERRGPVRAVVAVASRLVGDRISFSAMATQSIRDAVSPIGRMDHPLTGVGGHWLKRYPRVGFPARTDRRRSVVCSGECPERSGRRSDADPAIVTYAGRINEEKGSTWSRTSHIGHAACN